MLKTFVEPSSVALIGVSRRTGEGSFNILENLLNAGFSGRIYPVNPNASEILGIKTYPQIRDIPELVDLAVITTPRELVLPLLQETLEKGIKSIVVVAQGFADADSKGRELQEEMVKLARKEEGRILGPNTFGAANAFINFSSSFVPIKMTEIPVGVICQTGVFFVGFSYAGLIGKGLDLGNACDIGPEEGLEYFAADNQVKVIGIHIEGIKDGRRFLKAAQEASKKKPIIALKAGKGEKAAKAAQSHTGSLVGRDEVWDKALKQSGVIRAGDLDEFLDLILAFAYLPRLEGRNLGVVSFTGGFNIITIDSCERYELRLPELSEGIKGKISPFAPPWFKIDNPLDVWPLAGIGKGSQDMLGTTLFSMRTLLSESKINALLFIGGAFTPSFAAELSQLILEVAADFQGKPVVSFIYGPYAAEVKEEVHKAGISVVFPSPERAVRALSRMADYYLLYR